MPIRPHRRAAAALTTLALGAGLVASAAQASADTTTTPPWESSTPAGGTLTFYDASGAAVTSGSTSTGPFAAYAVGSTALRSGDTHARLEFANPVSGTIASKWYRVDGGISTYPNTSAPTPVNTASGPVWSGTSGSPSLESVVSAFDRSNAYPGYTTAVQVRLVTAGADGQFTATYAVADIAVDTTTHTWSELYPTNTSTPSADASSVAIAASPRAIRFGQATTVKALLQDTTTRTGIAGASLVLKQRTSGTGAYTTVGTATTTSSGSAALAVKPGSYRQFAWFYAGTSSHAAAQSVPTVVTVAQGVSVYKNHSSVKTREHVQVYGTVSPTQSGRTVYLQVLSGGRYVNDGVVSRIGTRRFPNGRTGVGYDLVVSFSRKATYTVRVAIPATSTLSAGYSVPTLIKVG